MEKKTEMLGSIIRKIRQEQGKTIREIAEKAKITRSLLSQIENSKANPSIRSLKSIADALNVSIGSFFDDSEENSRSCVIKADNRKVLRTQSGVSFYLLTQGLKNHSIEFLYNVYEKGASTGDFYSHEGEECGFVLQGKLEVLYGEQTFILEAGDSIYYNSNQPHKCTNLSEGETVVIWVNSPPTW
jgi:transcriptional regulator with XRE-family HTH domain